MAVLCTAAVCQFACFVVPYSIKRLAVDASSSNCDIGIRVLVYTSCARAVRHHLLSTLPRSVLDKLPLLNPIMLAR